MAEKSKIAWTDSTFNPWEGCTKISPGCDHCYAENRNARFAGGISTNWGAGAPRRRTSKSNWQKPVTWNSQHAEFVAEHGHRRRVFCASLADVFDNEVTVEWRVDLFRLIASTPNLDWLVLTKRIGNALPMMLEVSKRCGGGERPMSNVWIGATVVNQAEADRDIPKLLAVPAAKRFLSMEPLLGPVNLEQSCDAVERLLCNNSWSDMPDPQMCARALRNGSLGMLDWVIVGGESGLNARLMDPAWADGIQRQCKDAGVLFFMKQMGGTKDKRGEIEDLPFELRVRQFPGEHVD